MNSSKHNKTNGQASPVSRTRRTLLQNIGTVGAGASFLPLMAGLSSSACAQAGLLAASDLTPDVSLYTGAGSNVIVKKTGNGELIVVDGGLKANARKLRDLIRDHSNSRKFNTLVNTHWHEEQTGLNELLAGDAKIFAQENTRLWLSVDIKRPWEDFVHPPLPEKAQPDETYYHYGEFQVDDAHVQYGYMLQAHTDGDSYIYFPEDNVLHAGGVLSNDGWPLMDWWTGGWIGGLADGVETILRVANQDTMIVPANGPVMTYAEVQQHREMYATIYQRVRELFMQAKGPEESVEARPAAEFEDRMGNSDQFVLLAHQSVLAHFAPDA